MTPLMMLALTVPPSLAFVIERWMRGREEQARKLNVIDQASLGKCVDIAEMHQKLLEEHRTELKRLNEQLTTLSERVYR